MVQDFDVHRPHPCQASPHPQVHLSSGRAVDGEVWARVGSCVAGMLMPMEILGYPHDSVDVRLGRAEATELYNLLVEAESWPQEAVGPRPLIRGVRERLSDALEGFPDG
jgi:hypothetical protein